MKFDYLFDTIKNDCLVFDLETWSEDWEGNAINISSQFDYYVEMADVRWFGAYSFKHDKTYLLEYKNNIGLIKDILAEHSILVGFNSEEFDFPILKNNNLIDETKRYNNVDCMQILGKNNFRNKAGYAYKNRGALMKYKFKKNSLKHMAEVMKFNVQKGEIDYDVFKKTTYSEQEQIDIKKYLENDVLITKQLFEKLWDFWLPFTELLSQKFVQDLSWIKNSIASLTYKAACTLMGVEPTYSNSGSAKEEMGGRVIMPKYEEKNNIWMVDFGSLYPHIFCMFNLFAENQETEVKSGWHGNDVFKVRGYYFDNSQHPLSIQVQAKLKERMDLKKNDPKNPMIEALKNFLNTLYGTVRSSIFEKVHTPNAGWDCCWLGQQIQKLTEDMMREFGFESIMGDTDSLALLATEKKFNNKKYVQECLDKVIKKIFDNVPFPVDTFNIAIEKYLDYIMFPFCEQEIVDIETRQAIIKHKDLNKLFEGTYDDAKLQKIVEKYTVKEILGKQCIVEKSTGEIVKKGRSWVKKRMGLKKNYVMIYKEDDETKVKLKGLPIKKDGATALGIKIYNEVLKPLMIQKTTAKFSRDFIEKTVEEYLQKPNVMELIAREFKVKDCSSYKKDSQIHAQISHGYFNGGSGVIKLIKNNKVGRAGKGMLYCTIQEALDSNLTIKDLDLEKLWNELGSFIIYEAPKITEKKERKITKKKVKKFDMVGESETLIKTNDNVDLGELPKEKIEKKGLECYYEE